MEFRCTEADEFTGGDAEAYLAEHVVRDPGGYACPDTGARWQLDERDPEMPRLTRV
jgi:hypothetical protein